MSPHITVERFNARYYVARRAGGAEGVRGGAMFAKQFEATPCERLETTFGEAPRAGLSSRPVIVRSYLDRVGGSPRTSPLRVPRTFWFRDLLLDVGRSLTARRSMTPGVSYSSLERLVFVFGPHLAFPLDRHFVSHRVSC